MSETLESYCEYYKRPCTVSDGLCSECGERLIEPASGATEESPKTKGMTNGKQSLKQFFKKRRIYKPYLDIYLDVGFMRLKTELWRQSYERHEFTYIMLYWQFFKWSGKLRLYKPGVDL